MLTITAHHRNGKTCDGVSRRNFLKLGGLCVGLFHNATGLPMVLTMTGCALAGGLAFWLATAGVNADGAKRQRGSR